MHSWLVAGTAFLFIGFLLWKYRPRKPKMSWPRSISVWPESNAADTPQGPPIADRIAAAREKARFAQTPATRAAALIEAALLASSKSDGLTSATGLYLRAMRADQTSCPAILGLVELLSDERPELLESMLWRRLSHLPWSGDTLPAVRCAAEGLIILYRRELRHRDRARALQKLITRL